MRDVDATTITSAFLATRGPATSARSAALLDSLARHLHGFIREAKPTHAEWRAAIEFLVACGRITDAERNEFVLLSDVLGVSSLVDMVNSAPGGTPSSVLGPFHVLGAPDLPVGGDLARDLAGPRVLGSGRVTTRAGAPIEGAVLEIWQTASNGLYSNQDPKMEPFDLRARMTTGADGVYAFSTVRPGPYTVPTDGPVGDLLRAMDRHPWRPAHFHFIVQAPGMRALVTEVFPDDDPYLDQDAVFGVRAGLCVPLSPVGPGDTLPAWYRGTRAAGEPMFRFSFDFVLVPADAR